MTGPHIAPHPGVRVLAAVLGALTGLAVLAAAVAAVRLGWSWADAFDAFVVTNAVMGLAFGGCGVILAWHRPGNPIGWLFAAGGLLQAVAASIPPVHTLLAEISTVVRLRCGERLEVSVSDDGPTSGSWSPGVGLQTMRDRAAELGGAFSAGPSPAGGQVQAWFPLVA